MIAIVDGRHPPGRLLLARRARVPPRGPVGGLIDIALPIALGGIFVMLFAMQLKGRPLLPLQDAGLAKALTHHTH